MNPNVGKYTYSEVKEMTIFRRYELFGCLEAEDVMKLMLKESKEDSFNSIGNEEAQISEYAHDIVDDELLELEEMVDIHYIEK